MESHGASDDLWLDRWMTDRTIMIWGAADLADITTPTDEDDIGYPRGISWLQPMPPRVMEGIQDGPTPEYAEAYVEANTAIDRIANDLVQALCERGFRARPLAASDRTDPDNLRGDFPHKTAATLAGLGWVGRNCQLVTRDFGPWVRLGTVFTDMPLGCGSPVEESLCGSCDECVAACPAGALTGEEWEPGVKRERILDAASCDRWKKEHYLGFNQGHNCGICAAVCPFGLSSRE